MHERSAALAYALLSIAVLTWAGNFVLGRAIHADIPPISLAFWRWFVAALVLLPFAGPVAWRYREVIRREARLLVLLGVLGIVVFHVCVYSALQTTTATNGAIIQAAVPVLMPAVSWAVLQESVTPRQIAGILVSLIGVMTIVLKGSIETILELSYTPGDLWMLASVPVWALYSVLLRRLPPDLPRLAMLMAIVIIGLPILGLLYAEEVSRVGTFAVTVETLLAIAYVAIFASVIAYVCWNRGVMVVGPNIAGLFMHLIPVFATILAVVLLGERLRPYNIAGIAFVATGILLTTTARRPDAPG